MAGIRGYWAIWGVVFLGLVLVAPVAQAQPAPAQPVRAKVFRCRPAGQLDTTGGFGNIAPSAPGGSRKLFVDFSYATRSAADDARKADVVSATTRVEACVASAGTAPVCAGGSSVIYDASVSGSQPPKAEQLITSTDTEPSPKNILEFDLSSTFDYLSAENAGKFVFLRVNGENLDTARSEGGTCPVPWTVGQVVPAAGAMTIVGVLDSVVDPWGGAFGDSCSDNALYNRNQCISQTALDRLIYGMTAADRWQVDSLGVALSPPVASNGSGPACGGDCPFQVLIMPPNPGSGGSANIRGQFIADVDSVATLGTDVFSADPYIITLHEYFHVFQYAAANVKSAQELIGIMTLPHIEATAASIHGNACLFNFPGLSPTQCVSPGKLGSPEGGRFAGLFTDPRNDSLNIPYGSGLIWRYFMEQFALPPGEPGFERARPSRGRPSTIPLSVSTLGLALGDPARRSDEGADLIRHIVEALAQNPTVDDMTLFEDVLSREMAASFTGLIHEVHTANALKDYIESDPRWRYLWVGDYHAGAARSIKCPDPSVPCAQPTPARPLPEIKQTNPFFTSTVNRPDKWRRMSRRVDYFDTTPPRVLAPGATEANTQEEIINSYGAAYLSIHPDPAPGNVVSVRLKAGTLGGPDFRIFTADVAGNIRLIDACDDHSGLVVQERCKLDSNGEFKTDIAVGSGAGTVYEILLIASADYRPASFLYSFGVARPTLEIFSPHASHPASIGAASAVGGSRPFLVEFAVRDSNLAPTSGITPGQLRATLTPTIAATAPIVLTPEKLFDLTGGAYFARVDVPPSAFPAAAETYDLTLEYLDGASVIAGDTQPDAVTVGGTSTFSTQIVVDRSGSMNDFAGSKIQAAREAAAFLVDTLPDGDEVGFITFDHDANTVHGLAPLDSTTRADLLSTIGGLTASGCTSIGDALFEAQSNLAAKYDPTTPPVKPIAHVMLLTDGINTNELKPLAYYHAFPPDPNPPNDGTGGPCTLPDGNPGDSGPWFSQKPLTYHARKGASLVVPVISTIALGQDADVVEASNIAAATNGIFMYAPGSGTTEELAETRQALEDAYRQGDGHARTKSRIGSGNASGFGGLPSFRVEGGARDLQVSLGTHGATAPSGLRLVAPDGVKHSRVVSTTRAAVFRVQAPAAGEWRWEIEGTPPPTLTAELQQLADPGVFFEQSVSSNLVLFGFADVERTGATDLGADSERWVGKDVFIRAMPTDGGDIVGAAVSVVVVTPPGAVIPLALADDGLHDDGGANDGLYGIRFRDTQAPGVYSVRLQAEGTSPAFGPFRRERLLAFSLHHGPDVDHDGLPPFADPNPTIPDGEADPDFDGLTNRQEFARHTNPRVADSDAGGEIDGSEVARGRNPLDPADDAINAPHLHVTACFGQALHSFKLPAGHRAEIQAGPDVGGPYQTVFLGLPPGTSLTLPATDDVRTCYRLRSLAPDGTQSGWSPPMCITSRIDPYPPVVKLLARESWTFNRRFSVSIDATDEPNHFQRDCGNELASGVNDMLVAFDPAFPGAVWQPYQRTLTLTIPAGIEHPILWVKVRDFAGNESEPASLPLRLARLTDHAWSMFGHDAARTGRSPLVGPLTNRIAWEVSTIGDVKGSPAVDSAGTVYFGSEDNRVHAYKADGTRKWPPVLTGGDVRTAPALSSDGFLYVGSDDDNLYKINAATGAVVWKFNTTLDIRSSPAIGRNGIIYFGANDERVYALRPDKTVKWSFKTSGNVTAPPAVGPDGTVYVGSQDNHLYALRDAEGLTPAQRQIWRVNLGGDVDGAPTIGPAPDHTIYVGSDSDRLYAIRPSNGQILWSVKMAPDRDVETSAAVDEQGTVYVGSDNNRVIAVDRNGNTLWSFRTGGDVESSPALAADGILYVGSEDNHLYALRTEPGLTEAARLVWKRNLGGDVDSSPAIGFDGMLFVGSDADKLHAFLTP